MRLVVKRERVITPGAGLENDRAAAAETSVRESSVEVPNSSIAKASAILAAVLTLSQIASTLVSSWTGAYGSRAQVEINKEVMGLVEDNFRVQLLQRVLEEPDEKRRGESLRLLLSSGLLKDEDGGLRKLLDGPNYVPPQWKERGIEPLKDTLPLARGAAPGGGQSDGANTSRNTNTNTNRNANTNANANANSNNSNAGNANAHAGS